MPNPHPTRFLELLEATPGPVLDCGAGGRSLPGVIALELEWPDGATLLGDGLALPFRDDSFTLALSQAVLEHVTDPQTYVDELERVLAPGGLLWIEAAFMQPVHQAPDHYFNVTPFGLAHLCRRFEVLEVSTLGTYAEVVCWLAEAADVPTPDPIPIPTADRYFNVASGVAMLARKLGSGPTTD